MAAAPDPARHLLVVAIDQRSATAALRERLLTALPDPAMLLGRLREAGLSEAMVLSTCERLEVVAVDEHPAVARAAVVKLLAHQAGCDPAELSAQSRAHEGSEAVRHLFAVAASLESQVVGEPQILGQVKESHRQAAAAGLVGPKLEAVLQAAYGAAKRVRTETALARQPVSIAAAALLVARDVHGDLRRRSALLVGLGEMGEFLANEMIAGGIGSLVVVHPSLERAEVAAHRLGCHFRPWQELDEALAASDIVLAALGSGRYNLTAERVRAALQRRRREPIFMIDAAVPGDIDPAAGRLDGAFVYDLDDLERVAQQGKALREAETAAAWHVLGEELAGFLRGRAERSAVPSLRALRGHFEGVRTQVLADRTLDAEEATRRLVNRLLHEPSEALRAAVADADASRHAPGRWSLEAAVRRVFGLGGDTGDAASEADAPRKEND